MKKAKKPPRGPYNEAEITFFARLLYHFLDGDPERLLKDAAARATTDDASRNAARMLAEKARPELARLIRENPNIKKDVLLKRVADQMGIKEKETLRDILSRTKKHPLLVAGYVRDHERMRALNRETEAAEAACSTEMRRGTPPHTTPSRSASSPRIKGGGKGRDDDRKALEHRTGRRVPRHSPADAEEVANHGSVSRVREGLREPMPLLGRRAEEVDGRTNAPAHGRRSRTRGVRRRPPP
jgi:hypothetical protein